MSESVNLICRINSLAAEPERSQYQLQKPKRLSSTLLRQRKLSVIAPVHPRSKLVASTFKPLTKGFIDDNIYTDNDMLRLRASILRKTDIYEFDRIIGPNISAEDTSKRLYECYMKKATEQLFNGKSTAMVLLGCSSSTGKQEVFKGSGGILELTSRNILSLLKMKRTHDSENDHRLEVSLTVVIDGGLFDLAQERTVTSFKKTNRHEPSVIHVRHEEEFRSLVYLAENNLRNYERKLQMKAKEIMHVMSRFMLKRNGRVLGEISLARACNLMRMPKQDIASLIHLVDGEGDCIEEASDHEFFRGLLNQKTLRPNYLHLAFFVSPSPKLYEQSNTTLRVAEEFCNRTGKPGFSAQKENQGWSRNVSRMKESGCRESSLSIRKQLGVTNDSSRKMYSSNTKGASTRRTTEEPIVKDLERKNKELELRLQKMAAELESKQGISAEEKKLEFIEKEIEYRRKLKKYKDMVVKLEGTIKSRTYGESPLRESKVSLADPYKDQFEQLFQENLMLKEQNSVLRERLQKGDTNRSTLSSRSQAKLQSELLKLTREKSSLENKVKVMQRQIKNMISDEERDIQRLNRRADSVDDLLE